MNAPDPTKEFWEWLFAMCNSFEAPNPDVETIVFHDAVLPVAGKFEVN